MTESIDLSRDAVERLQLIEAGLAATGLSTRLHQSPAGADLTATLRKPRQREIEVVIDEDGYTEIRYWASSDTSPGQAVATIVRVISAITTAESSQVTDDAAGQPGGAVAGYDGPITQRAGERAMSGSGDQLAAHERGQDSVRPHQQDHPRETRADLTDLQARLERLPVGHPSSPYRDDGSRKPPPPDLSKLELALPDEHSSEPDQPDQDLPTEDKARVDPDGSWHWKGLDLKPEQSRAGDDVLARCHEVEKRLTPTMRGVESQLDHGHLVEDTDKFALKGEDRFKEKLAELVRDEWDKTAEQHAEEIHDGIRYTFILEPDHYVTSAQKVTSILQGQGFEPGVRKNNWGNDEFKGVNTRWRDNESSQRFEIQFHTEESWRAKQTTHAAYVKINDLRTETAEREHLRAYQREVSSRLVSPAGWREITDYRREGW
jgi:hypothetical protein